MNNIAYKPVASESEWEEFLSLHEEANFLQSWYFGEFHKRLGKHIQRTGFYKKDRLIGVMLSVVEPARRGRYLTVAGGPILDWQDTSLVDTVFKTMKAIAEEENCVFVRVRPQLLENEFSIDLFKRKGFNNATMHLTAELTSRLAIEKSEEELLVQMRKATRYEIKKAIKEGIKIKTTTNPKDVKAFYDIQLATAKRQHFVPFSYKFFLEQFSVFFQAKRALMYEAYLEKTLLAQAFIIFYGKEAVYHYGTGTEVGRKHPGAYLIQWEAIKEAKKRGMQWYNFWGIAPVNEPQHRFSGVSVFKRGFAGEDTQYLHAQDLVINKLRYVFNYLVEWIRKKVRKV
ncbi:MAG: peptidoglycan bridge formation glycyltransferase FemA/FemB family protein [Patescibacteria group bacterium]